MSQTIEVQRWSGEEQGVLPCPACFEARLRVMYSPPYDSTLLGDYQVECINAQCGFKVKGSWEPSLDLAVCSWNNCCLRAEDRRKEYCRKTFKRDRKFLKEHPQ